jgi:hypothetical protein
MKLQCRHRTPPQKMYISGHAMLHSNPPLYIPRNVFTDILTFNKPPYPTSRFRPFNSSMSQFALTYLPASHSLLSLPNHSTVSPANSGISTRYRCTSPCMFLASSVLTPGIDCNRTHAVFAHAVVLRNRLGEPQDSKFRAAVRRTVRH